MKIKVEIEVEIQTIVNPQVNTSALEIEILSKIKNKIGTNIQNMYIDDFKIINSEIL